MGKRPTSYEIHSYFKNAITVQCTDDSDTYHLDWSQDLDFYSDSIRILNQKYEPYSGTNTFCQLWSKSKGYAKILTYKTNQMKISKENIIKLDKKETTVRELFPSLFAPVLEKGKWYKKYGSLCFIEEHLEDKDFVGYGFCPNGKWINKGSDNWTCDHSDWKEATTQEVEEALKNEAVRNYKKGDYVKCLYNRKTYLLDFENTKLNGKLTCIGADGCLWMNSGSVNVMVFDKGKWTTAIETITKDEAEKLLNKKIVYL